MHIKDDRLLAGLQDCVEELAKLTDSGPAKTLRAAATSILQELTRRQDRTTLSTQYADGRAIAKHLARSLGLPEANVDPIPPALEFAHTDSNVAQFELLRGVLVDLIRFAHYPASPDPSLGDTFRDLLRWEAAQCCPRALPRSPSKGSKRLNQEGLQVFMQSQGAEFNEAYITQFTPLPGGFSKETVLFDATTKSTGRISLVARAGLEIELMKHIKGRDVACEYHLVRYLYAQGIRVAEPLWLQDKLDESQPRYYVSRQVKGRICGTAINAEPLNVSQLRSLACALASIHALRPAKTDVALYKTAIEAGVLHEDISTTVRNYLGNWLNFWQNLKTGANPLMEMVFSWLLTNVPAADDHSVLLHGDYGLHNILFADDSVGAVLDWEMAHVGDRAQDISWLLSSMRNQHSSEQFISMYIEAGGRKVDEFRLKYYDVVAQMNLFVCTVETQINFQELREAGPHYCILGLDFMYPPAASFDRLIAEAEAVRLRR